VGARMGQAGEGGSGGSYCVCFWAGAEGGRGREGGGERRETGQAEERRGVGGESQEGMRGVSHVNTLPVVQHPEQPTTGVSQGDCTNASLQTTLMVEHDGCACLLLPAASWLPLFGADSSCSLSSRNYQELSAPNKGSQEAAGHSHA